MALQFNASPYLQVWAQQQAQNQPPDINQTVTQPLLQGLSQLAESRRQQQLIDLQKQKMAQDQQQQTWNMGQEQRKSDYEYGAPIDPNAMIAAPTNQIAQSKFMPGGTGPAGPTGVGAAGMGQVATSGTLIDAFNSWRSGGMKGQARPEFMSALGKDERKVFADRMNPDPTDTYNPDQMSALFSGNPQNISSAFDGKVPSKAANLAGTVASRQHNQDAQAANSAFQNESQLQTKFLNESKDFKETATAFQRIQDSGSNPSAAGDLALIFNYMKMLDPGSTVREGEFANAQNSGSVPEILVARYNAVRNGERLSQSIRDDFMDRSKTLYEGQEERHRQREDEFRRIASGYKFNPDRVIVDLRAKPRQAPTDGGSDEKTVAGKTYRKINGEWFEL